MKLSVAADALNGGAVRGRDRHRAAQHGRRWRGRPLGRGLRCQPTMPRETPVERRKRLAAMRDRLSERFPAQVAFTESGHISSNRTDRSEKVAKHKERREQARPERPLSLPEIQSPERQTPVERAATSMDTHQESSQPRQPPRISKTMSKRFDKAEPMIRRAVREQWRQIITMLKQKDKRDSGIISEEQVSRCHQLVANLARV